MQRALNPYRPKTMQTYRRQFKLFMCYSLFNNAKTVLSVNNLLGFLELLVAWGILPRVISNYCSGISYLVTYQMPTEWMKFSLLANYLRAVHIQIPTVKKIKTTITSDFLHISQVLNSLDNPLVYRVAFVLAFYGFMRISNLVPPRKCAFDPDRQLCFRDVSVSSIGV